MKRRIIRSFFIGLLLLCVAGWVASYACDCFLDNRNTGTGFRVWQAGVTKGDIHIFYDNMPGDDDYDWQFDHRLFGFYAGADYNKRRGLEFLEIDVPIWFPTTISTALLWIVWRKTRLKAKGRAFPVEMEKSRGDL